MLQIFVLIGQVLQIFAFVLQIFALIGQVLQIFALFQDLHSCGCVLVNNLVQSKNSSFLSGVKAYTPSFFGKKNSKFWIQALLSKIYPTMVRALFGIISL